MTYGDVVFAADAGPQGYHGSREEGQAAAVSVILRHLTGQDAGNECPADACAGERKTYQRITGSQVAERLGNRTCNQKVAGLNSGRAK